VKSPALDIDEEGGRSRATVGDRLRSVTRKYATLIGLLVVVLLFTVLKPKVFLTIGNLRGILVAVAVLGVAAVGQTVVFALNDFDLSVGSVADLSGTVVASLMVFHHMPWPAAIAVGLLIGCACGAFNGFFVAYVNLNPFVVTLGTLTSFAGLSYLYNHSVAISGFSKGFLEIGNGRIGPVPVSVIVLAVVAFIAFWVMERTTIGRRWYAVGGNYDASYLAGVRVRRLRFLAFVACGGCAALAGMVVASQLSISTATSGDYLMLQSLAAVFLGMTAFKESMANIAGTIVGVLFLGVMVDGMAIQYVNSYVQQIVTGVVVIGSVALARIVRRQRGER